jgi:hypothetical protein
MNQMTGKNKITEIKFDIDVKLGFSVFLIVYEINNNNKQVKTEQLLKPSQIYFIFNLSLQS